MVTDCTVAYSYTRVCFFFFWWIIKKDELEKVRHPQQLIPSFNFYDFPINWIWAALYSRGDNRQRLQGWDDNFVAFLAQGWNFITILQFSSWPSSMHRSSTFECNAQLLKIIKIRTVWDSTRKMCACQGRWLGFR